MLSVAERIPQKQIEEKAGNVEGSRDNLKMISNWT